MLHYTDIKDHDCLTWSLNDADLKGHQNVQKCGACSINGSHTLSHLGTCMILQRKLYKSAFLNLEPMFLFERLVANTWQVNVERRMR